ncbi:homeobox protein Rhox13-like [Dipodomys merriami]|uniref:homeobox protein Rhox13-like n=1 Tax=Dipodomys merriami TaxID=94247 RepID=UPI0038559160
MTPPTRIEMEMGRMAAPEQGAAASVRGGQVLEEALGLVEAVQHLSGEELDQDGDMNALEDLAMESDSLDDPDQNGEQDQAELVLMGAGAAPHQRRRRRGQQIQFQFTQGQVDELETVFQETQYPDLLTRRVLARGMNVPEEKVQSWFNNRRTKYRRAQRVEMLRHQPQGAEDFISMTEVQEP